MNVTREVILDLLPVYLSGDASPATRALVEEYMKQDSELAQRVRLQWAENLAKVAPPTLPSDLELQSLRRTRRLIGWQRWLFSFGITFTALGFGAEFTRERNPASQLRAFHFLLRDYPIECGICLALGLACWMAYFSVRRRLRTA
ncbi:MAG: hypothetical protein WA175_13760 [Candidatus Acidiferrales bacterium]